MLNLSAHDLFFFAASGFVLGAISGGLGFAPAGAAIFLVAAAPIILIFRLNYIAVAATAVLFFAGNLYYNADDHAYHAAKRGLEGAAYFEGVVIDEPQRRETNQTVKVRVLSTDVGQGAGAKVSVRLRLYPELLYGDVVRAVGAISPPPRDSYGKYLAKERIHGTAFYPEIKVLGNEAAPFFDTLYETRRYIKTSINRLFSQRQAAFLSGITLGDREEFSREFLDKLSVSGTLHLTALSGLHMSIIVFIALAIFSAAFSGRKRPAFAATFFTTALFVAMTGFKISAIRASLMSFLAGLARQSGRIYNPRNAITFAAFVITATNPKAPVFDLGFQLSFAATISIIYFAPALRELPFFKADGFLGWRSVLAITIAAQLGVAPITIMNFGNFSFTALPANVAILTVMPVLMILGFATVAASAVSAPLAALLGKPTAFLLDYAIGVVDVFSGARLLFNPSMGVAVVMLYYAILIWISARWSPAAKSFFPPK